MEFSFWLGLMCVSISVAEITGNDYWGWLVAGIGLVAVGLIERFWLRPDIEEDEDES